MRSYPVRSPFVARRAGDRVYRLVEISGETRRAEDFLADDDHSALVQAAGVAGGEVAEVWRGATLVNRWAPRP